EPVAFCGETGESDRPDLRPDLGDDRADTIRLELLREGALLLNVAALSCAEGLVDVGGTSRRDRLDLVEVDTGLVTGVLEHGERLAAAEHDDLGTFELLPIKLRIGLSARDEEAVHLVDLREVHSHR